MAFGESATMTVAVAVIPGLRPAILPVNWKVTVYVVAPLDVVGSKAILETLASPTSLGSAVKAIEVVCPTAIFATSDSEKPAVTCNPPTSVSTINPVAPVLPLVGVVFGLIVAPIKVLEIDAIFPDTGDLTVAPARFF